MRIMKRVYWRRYRDPRTAPAKESVHLKGSHNSLTQLWVSALSSQARERNRSDVNSDDYGFLYGLNTAGSGNQT